LSVEAWSLCRGSVPYRPISTMLCFCLTRHDHFVRAVCFFVNIDHDAWPSEPPFVVQLPGGDKAGVRRRGNDGSKRKTAIDVVAFGQPTQANLGPSDNSTSCASQKAVSQDVHTAQFISSCWRLYSPSPRCFQYAPLAARLAKTNRLQRRSQLPCLLLQVVRTEFCHI